LIFVVVALLVVAVHVSAVVAAVVLMLLLLMLLLSFESNRIFNATEIYLKSDLVLFGNFN